MINVTKPYLPPREEFDRYIDGIWERNWLTNHGPLVKKLEEVVKDHLGVDHFLFVNNGTIAIQIAIRALELTGEIITTPFSYVATTNSILWENCKPVFADVKADDLCIDPAEVEKKITPATTAILAVHVYGHPCDVEALDDIARRHKLKIIYDGAQAFGTTYKGKSILSYGDISTCSFHATKVFHTIEGGAVITPDADLAQKLKLCHQFGHVDEDYFSVGINGKNSEFHAAMGLCLLPKMEEITSKRKAVFAEYDKQLNLKQLVRPVSNMGGTYNYAYYPVIFPSEELLLKAKNALAADKVNTRRYFYPSLNQLPFVNGEACPVSEDFSRRVLSLPLFPSLEAADIQRISRIINQVL